MAIKLYIYSLIAKLCSSIAQARLLSSPPSPLHILSEDKVKGRTGTTAEITIAQIAAAANFSAPAGPKWLHDTNALAM